MDITTTDTSADFCPLPGNDFDHSKIKTVSVRDLKKTARQFRIRTLSKRVCRSEDLKDVPFRSNNNIPMGHRIY